MILVTGRVAMAHHGLMFGENEAYNLQQVFGMLPRPPGHVFHTKIGKKRGKSRFR